jgi:hypothetical protein
VKSTAQLVMILTLAAAVPAIAQTRTTPSAKAQPAPTQISVFEGAG